MLTINAAHDKLYVAGKCFKPLYDCEIKQKYKNRIHLNNGNLSKYRSSYMKPNLISYLIKKRNSHFPDNILECYISQYDLRFA